MDARDRLFGEIALRLQLLSREQVAACMKAQIDEYPGQPIGEVATALGFMARDDVELVLSHQQRVLERRRDAAQAPKPAAVPFVVEDRAVRRDRRTDETIPLVAAEPAARHALPKPRLGNPQQPASTTLVSQAAPPPPAGGAPAADRRPAPNEAKAKAAASFADTVPDPELQAAELRARAHAETAPVRPDDYDFGAAPADAPAAGTGSVQKPRGPITGSTILQASGAAARAPADRGWRNPSRPPPSVPPPSLEHATSLHAMLALARSRGASDVHLHAGNPVLARIDGELAPLAGAARLAPAECDHAISELLTDAQWDALVETGEIHCSYRAEDGARLRLHAYRQERGLSAVLHLLPSAPASLEELALPSRLQKLVDAPRGLALFTGPAGSGKTSTLSALLAWLAENRAQQVVSVEAPIEIVQRTARGVLVQYEVPTHTPTLADGVRLALAQGARVLAISEISDASTAAAALRAADAGLLVLATLCADSSLAALERLLDLLGPEDRSYHARVLADALRLLTYQTLLPQTIGRGRVPAVEVIVGSSQVTSAIADDSLGQLADLMRFGKAAGMTSHADAVRELLNTGVVSAQAVRK